MFVNVNEKKFQFWYFVKEIPDKNLNEIKGV